MVKKKVKIKEESFSRIIGKEARYIRLIKNLPEFDDLVYMLCEGKKLCIFEIDVPSPQKKGLYGSLCEKDGVFNASEEKLKQLINDLKHSGMAWCIAKVLFESIV